MSHEISRVRHELRRRTLTVARIEDLNPGMRRVHFASPDMNGFPSVGFDDHVKMFIPGTGTPGVGPPAAGSPDEGGKPVMRDFTPRRFDVAGGTMVIDYAMHHAGPAVDWAREAKIGDLLEIGGPRGSAVVTDDFDWYWLIGDESALAAIGRRIEELRVGVPVTSIVLVDSEAEAQSFDTNANLTSIWVVREGGDDIATLCAAVASVELPAGDGFIWIAAEAQVARAVRRAVEARGHPSNWLKAAGYWQAGDPGVHIRIED